MRKNTAALLLTITAGAIMAGIVSAQNTPPSEAPFNPKLYSQKVTACDLAASHPDDPYHVAPGKEKAQIDLPKAIVACKAAVKADPKNPRLNYELGRVLGYSGRGAEGLTNRQAAVDANYPQALFVIGYITMLGMNQQPRDVCKGAELIRRSAVQGRIAGQLGFPFYVLKGVLDNCPVKKDKAELLGFVEAARKAAKGDYYQTLLADKLEEDLQAMK